MQPRQLNSYNRILRSLPIKIPRKLNNHEETMKVESPVPEHGVRERYLQKVLGMNPPPASQAQSPVVVRQENDDDGMVFKFSLS